MLAQTSIEVDPLRLAYDADRDGWNSGAFHKAVNTFGAAVVVAETCGGAIIGGYNPSGDNSETPAMLLSGHSYTCSLVWAPFNMHRASSLQHAGLDAVPKFMWSELCNCSIQIQQQQLRAREFCLETMSLTCFATTALRSYLCDLSPLGVGWIGLGEDRDSMAAFVFTWPDGDTSKQPIKLPKVGGAAQAVMDRPDAGPLFGPDGLRIPLVSSDPKRVCPCRSC